MDNLRLKFSGFGGQDSHAVRADTLVSSALGSLQRVFRIMGELSGGPDEDGVRGDRKNPPFDLLCHQSAWGCYDIPLEFHSQASEERRRRVLDSFLLLVSSVEEGGIEGFTQKFENGRKLEAALSGLLGISNLCASGGSIILEYGRKMEFDFRQNKGRISKAKKAVSEIRSGSSDHKADSFVIATLKSIDTEGFVLRFEYSTKKIPLEFSYAGASPSLARNIDEIVKSKTNPLEIHGDIKIKSGYAEKIKKLEKLRKVDLGKVMIREVDTNHGIIAPKKPLAFYPALDETGTIFVVDAAPFGNTLFEKTRGYLIEEIEDYLSYMWDFCAMEEDGKLHEDMLELKRAMLENFRLKGKQHEAQGNRGGPG